MDSVKAATLDRTLPLGGRRKGARKTGGRKKGTPNKATIEIKESTRAFLADAHGLAQLKRQYRAAMQRFLR